MIAKIQNLSNAICQLIEKALRKYKIKNKILPNYVSLYRKNRNINYINNNYDIQTIFKEYLNILKNEISECPKFIYLLCDWNGNLKFFKKRKKILFFISQMELALILEKL